MNKLEMEQMRWVQGWHMNAFGTLFGGQLLSWIDEDTMMMASLISHKGNFVTAGMERVCFFSPVLQGDRLRFFHRIVYAGKTSLWIYSEIFSEDNHDKVFSCYTSVVSVDTFDKPKLLEFVVDATILDEIPRDDQWRFVELLRDLHSKEGK